MLLLVSFQGGSSERNGKDRGQPAQFSTSVIAVAIFRLVHVRKARLHRGRFDVVANHPHVGVFAIPMARRVATGHPLHLVSQRRLVQPDAHRNVLALVVDQRVFVLHNVRRHGAAIAL